MTDTCIFCGTTGTDFKPEHWVSQWISRAAIPKGKGIEHYVPDRKPWRKRMVDLTVEHVCPDCNHHWMSDIETRVRDIALPLIQGETDRTLTRKHQERLATWCFMKAITSELGRPSDQDSTYPDFIYRGFKEFGHPPDACLVFVGFREITENPPLFVWFKSQGRNHALPGVGDIRGYRTALAINHLVIDVLGVLDARANPIAEDDARLVQLWPIVAEPLNWPPSAIFSGMADFDYPEDPPYEPEPPSGYFPP